MVARGGDCSNRLSTKKTPSSVLERRAHVAPEPLELFQWHMGKPEAEEHRIELRMRLPREHIGDDIVNAVRLNALSIERDDFW